MSTITFACASDRDCGTGSNGQPTCCAKLSNNAGTGSCSVNLVSFYHTRPLSYNYMKGNFANQGYCIGPICRQWQPGIPGYEARMRFRERRHQRRQAGCDEGRSVSTKRCCDGLPGLVLMHGLSRSMDIDGIGI